MKNPPPLKVSLITVCFNAEKNIEKKIQSLLRAEWGLPYGRLGGVTMVTIFLWNTWWSPTSTTCSPRPRQRCDSV